MALIVLSAVRLFEIQTHSPHRNLLFKTPIVTIEWVTLAKK